MHLCPVDRQSKHDPETVAFRQRVTPAAIAAALEQARESFAFDGIMDVVRVSVGPCQDTVEGLRDGWRVIGDDICEHCASGHGNTVPIWIDVFSGSVAYGTRRDGQAPSLK